MKLEEKAKAARGEAYTAWVTDPIRTEYRTLQEAEQYFMIRQEIYTTSAFIRSRRYAVRFIEENSQGCEDALIPYMAMTYYDRLGGKHQGLDKEIDLQLVVEDFRRNGPLFLLCCLTIAWKMRTKGFDLTMFLLDRNLDYTAEQVLEMEFLICRCLKWRLRTLTPFCFIEFMLPILGREHGKPSPRRPVRLLITRTQSDVAFLEYKPSVLAAAALLTISRRLFSDAYFHDFDFRVMACEYFNTDEINKCVRHTGRVLIQVADAILIGTGGDAPPPQPEPEAVPSAPQPDQRPGKEILESTSEIQPVEGGAAGGSGSSSSQVNQDLDWRMDFELGWISAQDENEELAGSGFNLLARWLEGCCSYDLSPVHCHIM